MKKIQFLLCATCALFVLVLLPFASAFGEGPDDQGKTLRIGMISSITGVFSGALKDVADGTKSMADVINQKESVTIKGQEYPIEIVIYAGRDSVYDPSILCPKYFSHCSEHEGGKDCLHETLSYN